MLDFAHPRSYTGLRSVLRRTMLVLVSIASMLGAGAALWMWLSPETIHATPTIELFALLALLFLPVATLGAMEAERRRAGARSWSDRARTAGPTPIEAAEFVPVESVCNPADAAVLAGSRQHGPHAPHDRPTSSPRHRARSTPGCSPGALRH
jgi:hypothetical protein